MPIDNYRIRDRDTFSDVAGESHEMAGLYSFLLLDCLVDLAHKVSLDFFKRPHLYTNLGQPEGGQPERGQPEGGQPEGGQPEGRQPEGGQPEGGQPEQPRDRGVEIAELLAVLHTRYGAYEHYPSKSQRDEIYVSLFGQSSGLPITDGVGDFPRLRDQLMEAARAFAERVYETGVEMLRERVRTHHRPFKEFLDGVQGASLRWSRNRALPILTEGTAYQILRDRGVAAVFGIPTPPKPAWPYVEDSNGDKLVEEISKQLRWDNEPGMPISREQFIDLQRAALRGAEAIATILDYNEEDADDQDQNRLITKVYTWHSALLSLRS